MRPVIGVILNPNAAGARSPALAARLRVLVDGIGQVIETRQPGELGTAVERFREQGCDIIATCGGDGTNQLTITEVVRRYGKEHMPRFAFLRGGTINTTAKNLRILGSPDQILERIVGRLRNGHPPIEIGQDLIEVNDQYGFLLAAGMGARFIESYYSGPRPGMTWASILALRTLGSAFIQGSFARSLFAPRRCTMLSDGERLPLEEVRLLLASVIPDVGIGMKVTWQANLQPNRFHLIASSLPTTEMALQIHRVVQGQPLAGQPHIDRLVRELDVEFPTPETYVLDGELFRARHLRIRVGPRLWILKP
ncbi:MAG TPA: diacylglycerol kinase family protein [Polyangia bacterium]|nr:diacylglycerol kinase family protein [Polyangia bacterium]